MILNEERQIKGLQIPDKLFGRQSEVDILTSAYEKVNHREGSFITISGTSGVGKSYLISHFFSDYSRSNILFAQGKFGQFADNKPYTAIMQIMEQIAEYILQEEEGIYSAFQQRIKSVLSDNCTVITSFSPTFSSILGPQPSPIIVGAKETKNRFFSVIENLLAIFSDDSKPLVLFFDDMQWADKLSIELMTYLFSTKWSKNILILVGYRSDEYQNNNDFCDYIGFLKANYHLIELQLAALLPEDIECYIAETLNESSDILTELGDHLISVTGGNAFYLNQYLNRLHFEKKLWYDATDEHWHWNIDGLKSNDDIDRFLRGTIEKLSKIQQQILQIGLLLKEQFTLSNLSMILDCTPANLLVEIKEIQSFDLLVERGERYWYKHDRISRSVRDSITDEIYGEYHLLMIRTLLTTLTEDEKQIRQMELANYFSSVTLSLSFDELQIAFKYIQASTEQSLKNGSYELALKYVKSNEKILDKLPLELKEKYGFDLAFNLARCYYLNSYFSDASKVVYKAFSLASGIIEKYQNFGLLKDIIISSGGNYHELLTMSSKLLSESSIDLPTDSKALIITNHKLLKHISEHINDDRFTSNVEPSIQSDANLKAQLVLLNDIWEAAYYDGDEAIMQFSTMQNVVLSLRKGNLSESAFGYVMLGMIKSLEGQYTKAGQLGEFAIKLNEHYQDLILLPKVTNLYCNYIAYYSKSFSQIADLYHHSAEVGRKNGDYLFGLWAILFEVWTRFLSGENLGKVTQLANQLQSFVQQTQDKKIIYVFTVLTDIISHLQKENDDEENLPEYGDYIEFWQQKSFLPGFTWLHILKGQHACMMGEYTKAYQLFSNQGLVTSVGIIMFPHVIYIFYSALAAIKYLRQRKKPISESTIDIEFHLKLLDAWKVQAPENFEYQHLLLSAEISIHDENYWQAQTLFNEAIDSAESYGNDFAIAFSHELKANFLKEMNDYTVSSTHLDIAINYYKNWGANRKVSRISSDIFHTNHTLRKSEIATKSSISLADYSRDLNTILKYSKIIFHERKHQEILLKTLEIIMNYSNSDKGAFIARQTEGYCLKFISDKKSSFTIQHINKDINDSSAVPANIIRYVIRSKNQLIIDDLDFSHYYSGTHYFIDSDIATIVCLPVLYHDNVEAILYLESSFSIDHINNNQLRIINVILTLLGNILNNSSLNETLKEESSKLKQTAEKLQESESRFALSTKYSEVGIWEWNILDQSIYWNEMVGPIFGGDAEPKEITYEEFSNYIYPEDRKMVEQAIQDCFDGSDYRVVHRIVWSDGTIHWVQESGDVIRNDEGQPIKMLGTVQDVSGEREMEEKRIELEMQLQQAQKMEALGQLTGGIAHDFNNLLGVNLGFAQLLSRKLQSLNDPKIDSYIEQILISGKRATNLVSQMMTFSRNHKSESTPVNLTDLTEETIKMLRSMIPSTIQIKTELDKAVPAIVASSVQLNQIIINICINARDALKGKGTILFRTRYHEHYKDICTSCHTAFSGEFVELSISDNARGITDENIKKIFNPFFTTKDIGHGTGMGLAMVHGILHSHNAHVLVQSEAGQGSQFRLFFRPSYEEVSQEEKTTLNLSSSANKKRILLVDDEQGMLSLLDDVLTETGHQVYAYQNSQEALKEILHNIQHFDLMITDQTMPHVTGIDLAKAALAIDETFPVIICTGYSEVLNEDYVSELGLYRLLQKPIDLDKLLHIIEKLK